MGYGTPNAAENMCCFGQCRVRTHRSEFRFDKNPHVSPGDPVVEDGDENEQVEENPDYGEETCRDGDKEGVPPAKEEDGCSVIKNENKPSRNQEESVDSVIMARMEE